MNAQSSIKYLIVLASLAFIAFYIIAPGKNEVLVQTSSGIQQCKNAEQIMKVVESYKNTYGYYQFSLADLLAYRGNLLERNLYKFTGDDYYLNNYGYSSTADGYEITFIGPESGKTYLIRSETSLSSACAAEKLGSL